MDEAKDRSYPMEYTEEELRRLRFQGRYWGAISLAVLQEAGIGSGMRVLDLGCGAGDFSLQAAELVGPSGSVLGIDRSPRAVQQARRRAAALKVNHLRFQAADLETIDLPLTFDALIGRFILMFLADPTDTLARMIDRLEPEGVVAFVETDLEVARSIPAVPRVETALEWIRETFRRAGINPDLGPRLWCLFRDAGLDEPRLVVRQKLHPAPCREGGRWVAEGTAEPGGYPVHTAGRGRLQPSSGILNQPNFTLRTSPFKLHPSPFKLHPKARSRNQ